MKSRLEEILERAQKRRRQGQPALPEPEDEVQRADADTLRRWRTVADVCPAIGEPLDERLPEWDAPQAAAKRLLERARAMVQRADARVLEGSPLLPRLVPPASTLKTARKTEQQDALRLLRWRRILADPETRRLFAPELVQFVDANLPDWRDIPSVVASATGVTAFEIVERCVMRDVVGLHVLPKQCCAAKRTDPPYSAEEWQEHRDAERLMSWRRSRSGEKSSSSDVPTNSVLGARQVMDAFFPEWRDFGDTKALRMARELVARAKERQAVGLHLLPKQLCKKRRTEEEDPEGKAWQEHVDAQRLVNWRCALRGKSNTRCSDELRAYLDIELPGWSAAPTVVTKSTSMFPPLELETKLRVTEEKEEGDDDPLAALCKSLLG